MTHLQARYNPIKSESRKTYKFRDGDNYPFVNVEIIAALCPMGNKTHYGARHQEATEICSIRGVKEMNEKVTRYE